MVILTVILLGLSYLALLRIETQQANTAIDENMVAYFNAMNHQDYNAMRQYLYPTDNEDYLLDILIKSKAVGVQSIRLQKIYPALVNNDIAIVGFETSQNAVYKGEEVTTRNTNTFFFRRKDGQWYIAKPQDLSDIPARKISDMIDQYKGVMKENMAGSIEAQQEYNNATFQKVKKGD